ncbi:MAG: glycosyltransferase family 2 protein [Lachnospiraceae bacterium]|nr:glycosyltransferase family 2 protein [Lachnospiraceae bacterium]
MSNNSTENIILSPNLSGGNAAVELCVVMPAYNEEVAIRDNLLEASRIISQFVSSYRIIAVNDGSKDNTHNEIVEAANQDNHISYISYSPNRGKGGAIAFGVEYAQAKYIAFLDSDLELSPSMLKDFMRELVAKDADVAIGSKLHPDSQLEYPAIRRFLSMGYYIFLKILFRLKLKDTQTGIKLFKGDLIKPICASLTTSGFAFDIEILAKISKLGYKIIEMPIKLCFNRDRTEKSRFSFKVVLNIFKETLKVKKAVKRYKQL